MARSSHLHHELSSLQAELHKPRAARAKPQPSGQETKSHKVEEKEASSASDLEALLKELGEALSEYTGSFDEFIGEHPRASLLGAFIAGIAIGRMTGGA